MRRNIRRDGLPDAKVAHVACSSGFVSVAAVPGVLIHLRPRALVLGQLVRIDRFPEDDEALEEEFRDEICGHRTDENDILIPSELCQGVTPPGRHRR